MTPDVGSAGAETVPAEVDPKFVRIARARLTGPPIICDIGSRDASEGIALMKGLDGKRLHVFEPNPSAAAICRKNLAQFTSGKRPDIAVFNEVAVTDHVGRLKFYPVNVDRSENKDIGYSSLFQVNPDYTKRRGNIVQDEVTVDATTLDEYFAGKENPDILWVDVEGAELQAFHGGARVLQHVKLIHVEVSFRPMQVGKPLFWEISDYLAEQGFSFLRFMEIPAWRSFLYRHRLWPNLPWRLNAVYSRSGSPPTRS